jgi:Cupredoxin-like domain
MSFAARRRPPVPLRVAACLATGSLILVSGCAAGSTAADPSTSSRTSSSPDASKPAKATDIVVSVKDGKVSPKTHRVKVAVGSSVRILVSSDVDDEVHVHGYDIEREISAGQSVTIDFTADQPGIFEVETHETDLLLFQLQVQ